MQKPVIFSQSKSPLNSGENGLGFHTICIQNIRQNPNNFLPWPKVDSGPPLLAVKSDIDRPQSAAGSRLGAGALPRKLLPAAPMLTKLPPNKERKWGPARPLFLVVFPGSCAVQFLLKVTKVTFCLQYKTDHNFFQVCTVFNNGTIKRFLNKLSIINTEKPKPMPQVRERFFLKFLPREKGKIEDSSLFALGIGK